MTPEEIVRHCGWEALAREVESVDALIVDAPYSEKTHAGHDDGTAITSKVWERSNGKLDVPAARRALNYSAWSGRDVDAFVCGWAPITRGWMVSITDDVLAPAWAASMRAQERYVFAPLAFLAPGSRVRLTGDGPSNWTTWIVVSRPKTKEAARWGTLPGGYVLPPGASERMAVVGGKPLWLMERLVEDYSRPGDLVCDPCSGGGTTLQAALRHGRRAIGCDILEEHVRLSREAVEAELSLTTRAAIRAQQQPLFGRTG